MKAKREIFNRRKPDPAVTDRKTHPNDGIYGRRS